MMRRILADRLLRSWRWLAPGVAAVGCLGLWSSSSEAGGSDAASPQARHQVVSSTAPALIRQRDSGQERVPLTSDSAPADLETASTSSAGLVEEPGVTSAGGVMVGLRGRFRTALVLERQADGSTTTRCISNLPGAPVGER